jgi:UDP-N-acetylglucosamine--N-acetylmuramyl-(pentapeptide) pyrophosphoryl-undecaprenol N-acetylglucosamine transferase
MKKSKPLIMLAAGGTGGHIFPAEALARQLLVRGLRVCLVTDQRGGRFSADLTDVPVHRIRARGLGGSFLAKISGAVEMVVGTAQAAALIARLKPALIVGFGGYPSVPTVFAASRMSTPILLHDQNAIIGRANKIFAPVAQMIATSFPNVKGLEDSKARVVLTGNPVRPAICALNGKAYAMPEKDGPMRILIMGGSLGAQVFSDIVPKAVTLLPEALRKRLVISQQCRGDDLDATRQAYAMHGIAVELATFFNDVPERLANCHFAICRSGASTVAEMCVAGRPAIYVPYPFAIAGEQQANAESVAEAGGGWVIPQKAFTPEALAIRLETLLAAPEGLARIAAAAKGLARIDAAEKLADLACSVINYSQDGQNHGYTEDVTTEAA